MCRSDGIVTESPTVRTVPTRASISAVSIVVVFQAASGKGRIVLVFKLVQFICNELTSENLKKHII